MRRRRFLTMASGLFRWIITKSNIAIGHNVESISAPSISTSINEAAHIEHDVSGEVHDASDANINDEIKKGALSAVIDTSPSKDLQINTCINVEHDITVYGYLIGLVRFIKSLFVRHDVAVTPCESIVTGVTGDIEVKDHVTLNHGVATMTSIDEHFYTDHQVDAAMAAASDTVVDIGARIGSIMPVDSTESIDVSADQSVQCDHIIKMVYWVEPCIIGSDVLLVRAAYNVTQIDNCLEVI